MNNLNPWDSKSPDKILKDLDCVFKEIEKDTWHEIGKPTIIVGKEYFKKLKRAVFFYNIKNLFKKTKWIKVKRGPK